MITLLFMALLSAVTAQNGTFDATAAQRSAAFSGVGAPVGDISIPMLRNVSTLQPNTTFRPPTDTQTRVESAGDYDYSLALTLPWKYMKAERLGRLPADDDIPWRAASFLDDPVLNGLADAVGQSSFSSLHPLSCCSDHVDHLRFEEVLFSFIPSTWSTDL